MDCEHQEAKQFRELNRTAGAPYHVLTLRYTVQKSGDSSDQLNERKCRFSLLQDRYVLLNVETFLLQGKSSFFGD